MFQLSWLVSRIKDLFEFFPDIHGYGWSSPWFPAATTPPEDRRELGCPNGKAHRGSRGGVVSGDGIGYKKPEKTRGFSPGLWPIWGIFMGSMWPYIAAPWIRHGWWIIEHGCEPAMLVSWKCPKKNHHNLYCYGHQQRVVNDKINSWVEIHEIWAFMESCTLW
jgi:hypothetical protein